MYTYVYGAYLRTLAPLLVIWGVPCSRVRYASVILMGTGVVLYGLPYYSTSLDTDGSPSAPPRVEVWAQF